MPDQILRTGLPRADKTQQIAALAVGEGIAPPPPLDMASIFDAADLVHFGNDRGVAEARVYNWYAAYGAAFRPASILEIGVRRGYGAFALIKGAGGSVRRYVGIDMELDIPGSNAQAARTIADAGCADIEMINANTRTHFPQLSGVFDLIHIDGDHSMEGALSDFANVLRCVAPGGVIVMDDAETASVRAAVDLAIIGLGYGVRAQLCGDLHRQAVIQLTQAPPALSLAGFVSVAPDGLRHYLRLERAVQSLRALASASGEAAIARGFGEVAALCVAALGEGRLARPARGPSTCASADDIFVAFADVIAATSDAAIAKGLASLPWEREAREHGGYALARLDGVAAPAFFAPVVRAPGAFQRGAPSYNAMLLEAASNLAAVLQRAIGDVVVLPSSRLA